jgi:adhesin transport system membrane fusion protein
MARNKELEAIRNELHSRSGLRGSVLLFVIIMFLVSAGYWAAVTEIDDVTRADGKVVPTAQTQVIQSSESGVLIRLAVAKGDIVEPGQILMEFDRIQLESQLTEAQRNVYAHELRIIRLRAEVAGIEFSPPASLISAAPQVHRSEADLYLARRMQTTSDLAVLDRQLQQHQGTLNQALSQSRTAANMLALVLQEKAIMIPLVERRIEPETTLLALSRSETEWLGQKEYAAAQEARARAQLAEVDAKRSAIKQRRRAEAQGELAGTVADFEALKPRIEALEQRVARTDVRSPVLGVVNQILLTTIGGVVQAGQSLMEIVPMDQGLLIEAYVRPADIAFLYPGQPVKVNLTAYDFSRYGGLEGEIARIGANAITREETKEQVFVVEVRTASNILDASGAALEIIPGMVAQVDILSEKKTVLDYIIRPVVRVKQQAFRD